jgi:hypothetical protein
LAVNSERVWTNSVFGRIICTTFGVVVILLPFGEDPKDGTKAWQGSNIPIDLGLVIVGLVVIFAVWTSRLVLSDGVLTATNFGVSRSMPLREVVEVDAAAFPFLGMKIRRGDKSGIRTLISGRTWDELWTTRAEKIGREIVDLAKRERAGYLAAGGDPIDPGDREWGNLRYLAAVAFVFILGIALSGLGVLALLQPFEWQSVPMLFGLLGGPALVILAGRGLWAHLASEEPVRRTGQSGGRHARQ